MNAFRTELVVAPSDVRIHHQTPLLALGSCFVAHIGTRLHQLKFPITLNPFGIIFNPGSVAHTLERLLSGMPFEAGELIEYQQCWHSPAHHGQFSHPRQDTALVNINQALTQGHLALQQATRLIITLGSAHVFVLRSSGKIVANCHKLPAALFERRRLSVDEIIAQLSPLCRQLQQQQAELQIILTVSPVRYLRDGFTENQRSKASLILAAAALCEQLPFVHYFPAYELFMDDLRDYRFCDADMIHPNQTAIDYIWQAFVQTYCDDTCQQVMQRIAKINQGLNHRPLHPESEAHRKFIQQWHRQLAELEADYPWLDFSQEKEKMDNGMA